VWDCPDNQSGRYWLPKGPPPVPNQQQWPGSLPGERVAGHLLFSCCAGSNPACSDSVREADQRCAHDPIISQSRVHSGHSGVVILLFYYTWQLVSLWWFNFATWDLWDLGAIIAAKEVCSLELADYWGWCGLTEQIPLAWNPLGQRKKTTQPYCVAMPFPLHCLPPSCF